MSGSRLDDLNAAAIWAGLTAFVWFAFGAIPLQVAVAGQLGLTTVQTSSWIFIVWFTGAVSSIAFSWPLRRPISITWTIPGLIYLGTLAGQYSTAELVGANLVAGLIMLAAGAFGVGERLLRWLPLSTVMGMFAGSILSYGTRAVEATVQDVAVAGATVAGYVLGRALQSPRVPPVGLAVLAGGVATVLTQRYAPLPIVWTLPSIAVSPISVSVSSVLAVSVPLAILAMGLGNVQGLGYLLAQGYRIPVNQVSLVVGAQSVINALFGGHPATVARIGSAILAAPDAGPREGRYWASIIAAALTMLLAFAAVPVATLVRILPEAYIFALAGVAILSSLQDAFEKSFSGNLRFGALVAFVIAATPFAFLGVTSAFWALVAGLAVSFLTERRDLLGFWRDA